MTDQEQIAAFLASKGAAVVADGVAYGVDKAEDRAKRAAERQRVRDAEWERKAEQRAEAAHDAFFTGDREEGYALMTGWRRVAPGRYVRC